MTLSSVRSMSLSSVSNTAHSALSAIGMAFDVIANNLANAQTDGFKESHVIFTSATPVTYGIGSEPDGRSGGTNPIQVGTGMGLAFVATNFRQGPLEMAGGALPGEEPYRELSNTDIGQGLVDMTLNLDMFRVNAFVFQSVDRIFDDLLSLRRT